MEESRDEHFKRVEARRTALLELPLSEVQSISSKLVEDEQRKKDLQAQLDEHRRFFFKHDAKADFSYWSKYDHWTLDESIALLLGRDPRRVTWALVEPYVQVSSFAQQYRDLRAIAGRAKALNFGNSAIPPSVVIAWAREKGLTVPTALNALEKTTQGHEQRWIGGRRLWRISEAVVFVTSMPGFGVSRHGLEERLSSYRESALLKVASGINGALRDADHLCVFIDCLVYAEDFNNWLELAGFHEPYRLPLEALKTPEPGQQLQPAPLPRNATLSEAAGWEQDLAEREKARAAERAVTGWHFLDEAAADITRQRGLDESFAASLLGRMKDAVTEGLLVACDEAHKLPVPKGTPGCDTQMVRREIVNKWLSKTPAGYLWEGEQEAQAAPRETAKREALQRSQAQHEAILDAIRAAGHEPKNIPKNPSGKPGVKAQIRAQVAKQYPGLFPPKSKTFEKAWDRLRSFGDVADRKG